MTRKCMVFGFMLLLACAAHATPTTSSFTGILSSPTDVEYFNFNVPTPFTMSLQTFGFGAGGTDPFVAIFSGVGNSAAIVTDGMGNPYGTSLDLSNYADFSGCGLATAPDLGGGPQCGDIFMSLALAAGQYTIVLSDGQYVANAVYDNGTLGEGFVDFTGTVADPPNSQFCNILINGVDCTGTGHNSGYYELDITIDTTPVSVPEPATLTLVAAGVAAAWWKRRRL